MYWTQDIARQLDNALHEPDAKLDALLARGVKDNDLSAADRKAVADLFQLRALVAVAQDMAGGKSLAPLFQELLNRRIGGLRK